MYYLRDRYYDPSTAQFLTVDAKYGQTGSPYAYAGNDPINSSDPSGACPPCVFAAGFLVGAGADLGMQVLINVANGCDPFYDISWGSVLVGGLTGAVGAISFPGAALRMGSYADRGMTFANRMRQARRLEASTQAGGRTLVHYTDEAGMKGILDSKVLNPSLRSVNPADVRYGNGQYLSDITPGTMSCAQLSRCFLGQPFQGQRYTHFVEINVDGLNVIQGRAHVFVVPGDSALDIARRVMRSGVN